MIYDVIIIGAGNGGLAAAATCAKEGLSTLLLERHNIPGGSASSFVRGRFEFEPSLHELSGVGAPDKSGQIEDMFIRMGGDVQWHTHDSTFRLVVPAKPGDKDTFIKASAAGSEAFGDNLLSVMLNAPSSYNDALLPDFSFCDDPWR